MVPGMVAAHDTRPLVSADGVTFRLERTSDLNAAWLYQEVAMPRGGWRLHPSADGLTLELRFPRPEADRMEYLFELVDADGGGGLVCDPANPLRAPGPFGDKSVVEFPSYEAPAWVSEDGAAAGTSAELTIQVPSLGCDLRALLWTAPGVAAGERVPLLVAHDGIEYAQFSSLSVLLDRFSARGELPRLRAALLHPAARDEHYSASPAYARALATEVLPYLATVAPTPPGRRWRVGMGASLGALAMLHAHRSHPATFGGLFLQSGSFFHHRYDQHDIGFEHFQRVRWFMDRVHAARAWDQPVPVVVTCGAVEMNLPNNRAASLALRRQGYPVRFVASRDAHNWTAWRDLFDPHLVALLGELWA
jgi:enterochelin esterase-like enzyme